MLHDVEASCDAIIAKLTAELPAKLTAINAEITDGWVLEAPAGITLGSRSETPYPWIIVRPLASELISDSAGRTHEQHAIEVAVWVEDSDEEALARRLIRYKRAVREVVLHYRRPAASYTDGGGGYGLQFGGASYGPTMELEDNLGRFVSWIACQFNVQQQQDL